MADADPYAKYLKPGGAAPVAPTNAPAASSDTDPYSKFLPASQAAPASTTAAAPSVPLFILPSTSNDKVGVPALDPRTATTGDYLAKLHQDASGWGQKDGQTVAQQVEAAAKDIGPVASAGAASSYGYAPDGSLASFASREGPSADLLRLQMRPWRSNEPRLQRIGGRISGTAGAIAANMRGGSDRPRRSGRQHDQDRRQGALLKSALISTATEGGPIGGAGERPTTRSTADLGNTADRVFVRRWRAR